MSMARNTIGMPVKVRPSQRVRLAAEAGMLETFEGEAVSTVMVVVITSGGICLLDRCRGRKSSVRPRSFPIPVVMRAL